MSIPEYPPKRDGDLVIWSANFADKIDTMGASIGLLPAQVSTYRGLNTTWQDAFAAANEPSTNSKAAVIAKNQVKEALLRGPGGAKELTDIVQAFPGTTDAMRGELGIRIKDVEPTPIPAPTVAPTLIIKSTTGRQVKVRLRDAENPDRRGKPDGVDGAAILTFVGAEAPADSSEWSFAFNTSKTVFDVDFPATVAVGAKVWLTAFWFNPRKQSSPPATPQSTHIGAGVAMAA